MDRSFDELSSALALAIASVTSKPTPSKPSKAAPAKPAGEPAAKAVAKPAAVAPPPLPAAAKAARPAAPAPELPRRRRAPYTGAPKLPLPDQRNILITSALPYVNNVPHLGNLIGCVLSADVYARFCRQRNLNAIYICGTDEYGTATEAKAQEEGLTPREVCTKYFDVHRKIYEWFEVSFDYFGRTSCDEPRSTPDWPQTQICQEIFNDLLKEGRTAEQSVDQVFCLGCNKFLADRFIVGKCPHEGCGSEGAGGDQCDACGKLLSATDLIDPKCKVAPEHKVEIRTSDHIFLDLTALEPTLADWFRKASSTGGWSDNSVQITEAWLKQGLKPRCITRDLKWGTPVPLDKYGNKVFYVWFDAPIGYISITANYTPEWRQWWNNPDNVSLVQFMGKDNVPFHTVIFPSSLLGTGKKWTLLNKLSTTEYLNYEGTKFSKSRNMGVFGNHAVDTGIPCEVWRYYLFAVRPESSDCDFNWDDFAARNNNELLKNLGNFINRALKFTYGNFDKKVPGVSSVTPAEEAFKAEVDALLKQYIEAMETIQIRRGLQLAMAISAAGNKYLQDTTPWKLVETDKPRCATILTYATQLVKLLATLFEPYMPSFTDKVLFQLNLDHSNIPDSFEIDVPAGHELNEPAPLFRNIQPEEVAYFRGKYGTGSAIATSPVAGAGGPAAAGKDAPAAAAAAAEKGGKGKKGGGGGGGGGGKAAAPAPDSRALNDISRIDLRVGQIVKVWHHETADKLFCEEIDVGEGSPRLIASGLRPYYTQEQMLGRRIIVVCNLKPRAMMGFTSHGMVLCAANADRSVVEFVDPPPDAKIGDRIVVEGYEGAPEPEVNPAKKGNSWVEVAPLLATDASRVACFNGKPMRAGPSGAACIAPTIASGPIS